MGTDREEFEEAKRSTEMRAGSFDGISFTDQSGGSLINDRAIVGEMQERVLGTSNVRTFRTSLNTLGDGEPATASSRTAARPRGPGCGRPRCGACGRAIA